MRAPSAPRRQPAATTRTAPEQRAVRTEQPAVRTGQQVVPAGDRQPAAAVAARPARARTPLSERRRSVPTPSMLTVLRVISVLMILLFGLSTTAIMLQTRHAMTTAADNTEQYQRVQDIQASLLSAHASAANGFLLGGVESQAQQTRFREDLAQANRLILDASNAESADREALSQLDAVVSDYTTTIESARAANAQGLAVGTAQLNQASVIVADRALPVLKGLSDANSARVDGNTTTIPSLWVLVAGGVTIATLFLAMWETARRTHRVVNLGLLGAMVAVGVATAMGFTTMAGANDTIRVTRDGQLQTARAASSARAHAYDAKAMESLALISRASSGGQDERQWSADSFHARRALKSISDPHLSRALQDEFRQYVKVHRSIREHDLAGEYDRAVAKATGEGPDAANAVFQRFDDAISATVRDATAGARTSLDGLGGRLLAGLLTALGLTLAAMAAAALGIGQRLKEYQ